MIAKYNFHLKIIWLKEVTYTQSTEIASWFLERLSALLLGFMNSVTVSAHTQVKSCQNVPFLVW
jgi:hypothetical protein